MFYWTLTRSFLSFYFGQSVALRSKNTPDVMLCTPLCSGSRTDKRTHVLEHVLLAASASPEVDISCSGVYIYNYWKQWERTLIIIDSTCQARWWNSPNRSWHGLAKVGREMCCSSCDRAVKTYTPPDPTRRGSKRGRRSCSTCHQTVPRQHAARPCQREIRFFKRLQFFEAWLHAGGHQTSLPRDLQLLSILIWKQFVAFLWGSHDIIWGGTPAGWSDGPPSVQSCGSPNTRVYEE